MNEFVTRLIAETLFYDEEYGAIGSLSLVDEEAGQERYIASFVPDEGIFLIEEATEWEQDTDEEEDAIGYDLAVDSKEYNRYATPEETAAALLVLAQEKSLQPSITLLFEEDEVS